MAKQLSGLMLSVPFKTTERVSFIEPLKHYIATAYAEDAEVHLDDLRSLDALRASVTHPQPHEESATNHWKYFTQLMYLATKFKIDQDGIMIVFTWESAFGSDSAVSSHNIGYLFRFASFARVQWWE